MWQPHDVLRLYRTLFCLIEICRFFCLSLPEGNQAKGNIPTIVPKKRFLGKPYFPDTSWPPKMDKLTAFLFLCSFRSWLLWLWRWLLFPRRGFKLRRVFKKSLIWRLMYAVDHYDTFWSFRSFFLWVIIAGLVWHDVCEISDLRSSLMMFGG